MKNSKQLRITGGALCGRRIIAPGGIIRPSMDQMRESVFACLGDLGGLSFLDVFSGSGIIALEAASRGAEYIEAVENDPLKHKTLLQNILISPVRIQCRFISAELYVKRAKRFFDIIFLDPPFPYQYKWDLVSDIASSVLADQSTRILIHRPLKDNPGNKLSKNLEIYDSRRYGSSHVDFIKVNE